MRRFRGPVRKRATLQSLAGCVLRTAAVYQPHGSRSDSAPAAKRLDWETVVTVIDFTAFIGRLATASGETILPFFRTSLSIENKSNSHDFDPVTEADRAAEAVMRRLIKDNFPQHGIVGEEFGSEQENAEYVWVLDPIDGTKSFIAGFPLWGTLIALLHKGTPVFGMMHQPYIGERFSGDSGSAHYQGPSGERKLAVRRCASLSEATAYTTSPLLMNAADRAAFG